MNLKYVHSLILDNLFFTLLASTKAFFLRYLRKSWHPGTFRNQEKVWKEERKAAEEDKKIAQKRKELEEERQIQELQQIQESSGARKRAERVEWLYAAPNQSNKTGSDMEEYLLGKRRVDELFKQKNDSQQVSATFKALV